MASLAGVVQGRGFTVGRQVDGGALLEEDPCCALVLVVAGDDQGRVTVTILRVHQVPAFAKDPFKDTKVSGTARFKEFFEKYT